MGNLQSKVVLCLIGGIGSGKSRVAEEFARYGGRVISGDGIGHNVLQLPEVKAVVAATWGPEVLDERGEVNRRKVAGIVFADPAERQRLEGLVFPHIKRRLEEEVRSGLADPLVRFVVVDAAVALEAGWDRCCDAVVYVHAPRAARLECLARQRGWTEQHVKARENAQLPLAVKAARADYVVDNSGAPEEIGPQVRRLLEQAGVSLEKT